MTWTAPNSCFFARRLCLVSSIWLMQISIVSQWYSQRWQKYCALENFVDLWKNKIKNGCNFFSCSDFLLSSQEWGGWLKGNDIETSRSRVEESPNFYQFRWREAAHVVWAKIKTNAFYSIIERFNMQVWICENISKKKIYVVTYISMANIV